jgi:flavodoxin
MKMLIAYYSFTHNNELLAKVLQKKLKCDLLKIEEVKKRNGFSIMLDLIFNRMPRLKPYPHNISSYDHCILIAPVWAGKFATPLKAFLNEERFSIKDYSFISVCGGGNPTQGEKISKSLIEILNHPPVKECELWINDLLPDEKKNTIKHVTGYRITESDLKQFEAKINDFLDGLRSDTLKPEERKYSLA